MSRDDDIQEIKSDVKSILRVLAQHGEKLEEHDRRFESSDQRFEQIDRRFEEVDRRFERVEARLDRHDEYFVAIIEIMNDRFEKIDRRFEHLEERFQRLEESFLRQELILEEWRSDCRIFTEGFRSNQERIGGLETRVDTLERKVG